MAHKESDVRIAAKVLLEKYGCLTTSEIIKHMPEVMTFDEDDLVSSPSRRSEPMIYQIIRNPALREKCKYEEGIYIDKSTGKAIWYPTNGLGAKEQPIAKDIAKKIKQKSRRKSRKAKHVDWDDVNERRTVLGKAGETFIFQSEIKKVSAFSPEAVNRVILLSEKQGDGEGYDVLSLNENGETIRIEVKTTTKGADAPFYMSINELEFFKENKNNNNVFLYRVYNFVQSDARGDVLVLSAKDLLDNYVFDPISFKVIKKAGT